MQEAETDGRGATEFGRARQGSQEKLPLPVASGHVTRSAPRGLKSQCSVYEEQNQVSRCWGGAKQDRRGGDDTSSGKQWLPRATASTASQLGGHKPFT